MQPRQEAGRLALGTWVRNDLGEPERHGLRVHRPDHRHLLIGCVAAARFAGDLDHEVIADRLPDHLDGLAIGARIERVAAIGLAHVQVQQRRPGLAASRRGAGNLAWRDWQGRVIRLGLARTRRRDADDEPRHPGSAATAASTASPRRSPIARI